MSMRNQKGFVPVDLLIITQIAVLAFSASLAGARQKAMSASFRSSAFAVTPSAILCCDSTGARLNNVPGKNVCSTGPSDGNYPSNDQIGSIEVRKNCEGGRFELVLTPGTANAKSGIRRAICTEQNCIFE